MPHDPGHHHLGRHELAPGPNDGSEFAVEADKAAVEEELVRLDVDPNETEDFVQRGSIHGHDLHQGRVQGQGGFG